MLRQIETQGPDDGRKRVVIADMEAGAGTLTRMPEGALDLALLVTEPSAKSIEVAQRASEIIAERRVGPILIVANKVSGDADLAMIRAALPAAEVFEVPEDPAVLRADRVGGAPIDLEPASPAVAAVTLLGVCVRNGACALHAPLDTA